jgi:hypothetical protein
MVRANDSTEAILGPLHFSQQRRSLADVERKVGSAVIVFRPCLIAVNRCHFAGERGFTLLDKLCTIIQS